jgi:homocysteine S-methyltransferase
MIPGQEYSGAYDAEHDSEESLYVWHLQRLRMFVDAGVVDRLKYVAFETLPRLDEVRAVRRAMRDSGIQAPFWIACVFPRDDDLLPDGSEVREVVGAMLGSEGGPIPWGIGINCTKMHKLSGLLDLFGRSVKDIAGDDAPSFVLYPDGTNGEVYNTTTQIWEKPSEAGDNVSDNVSTTCAPRY